ncbi:LysR family transcriptional regulator [Xanthobacter sp. V4C-4]|uniref:LysR family transcriptional regulator n=1 Tax=Xanthobacter cornucopiae TaxID=3119924 RepID=UPI0037295FA0
MAVMFVRQLQYLVAVAREGHFGRAAGVCQVSQPTLSAGIRRLEEELGLPLVIRSHRFLGLTDEGVRVLTWARRMVADYDGLLQELSGTTQGLCGLLRIGAVASAMPALSPLLNGFCARHPKVRVQVQPLRAGQVQRSLDERDLDAAVTLGALDPLNRVRSAALYEERYVFLGRSPAAHRDAIAWAEAANHPLCLLTPDTETRRIVDSVLATLGLSSQPRLEVGDFPAVWSQVRGGGWCSIVPHSYVEAIDLPAGLAARPLVEPDRRSAVSLVIPDRDPPAPLAAALLRHAQPRAEPAAAPADLHRHEPA